MMRTGFLKSVGNSSQIFSNLGLEIERKWKDKMVE